MFGPVIDNDLFDYALIKPLRHTVKPDSLKIVSGYASHALASGHISVLKDRTEKLDIDLVVGMTSTDGVKLLDHKGFISLHEKREFEYDGSFVCRYVKKKPAVHSKVYVWCKNNRPVVAFAGSANYTNNGFKVSSRKETLVECDPVSAYKFFLSCQKNTVECQNAQKDVFVHGCMKKTVVEESPVFEVETDTDSPFYGWNRVRIELGIG